MLTVGLSLIKKLLAESNIDHYHYVFNQIDRSYFRREEKPVIDFLTTYIRNHRELPDINLVIIETNQNDLSEDIPNAPYDYWITAIKNRKLNYRVSSGIAELSSFVSDNNWDDAKGAINRLFNLVYERTGTARPLTLLEASPDVIEAHDLAQVGRSSLGVRVGIPQIDESTGGVFPGDNWALVAKTEVGKTYLALSFALGAATTGKKILFVSMEMPTTQIATRALALESNINAQRLRLGRVGYFGIRNLLDHIGQLDRTGIGQRIVIVPGDINLNIESIERHIQEHQPDLVIVDGAYLVKLGSGQKRVAQWERVQLVVESLKSMAITYETGIIGTYQYDQKVKGGNISLGSIMGGQAISFAASIVLYLEKDENEEDDFSLSTSRILTSLKGREGESFRLRLLFDLARGRISVSEVLSDRSGRLLETQEDPFNVD